MGRMACLDIIPNWIARSKEKHKGIVGGLEYDFVEVVLYVVGQIL